MGQIQKEVWAADISRNLFPDSSWTSQAVSHDQWVNFRTVHVPNAGSLPTVVKNRVSVPATNRQRIDISNDYMIAEYTTDPDLIRHIDQVEVSYDKRMDVLTDHIEEIEKQIANNLQVDWAPTNSANILRTTGDPRVANTDAATGNRKALSLSDIIKAANLFDDMDIPRDGKRCILLPAHMYNDLWDLNKTILTNLQQSGESIVQNGGLMNLYGFKIFMRGKKNVLRYNNAAVPAIKNAGSTGSATDNAAALAWHPRFVTKAKGSVEVFYNEHDPNNYGDIFSALARAGGVKRYQDETGVVSIVESAAA